VVWKRQEEGMTTPISGAVRTRYPPKSRTFPGEDTVTVFDEVVEVMAGGGSQESRQSSSTKATLLNKLATQVLVHFH